MKFASFDLEIMNDFPLDGSWDKELGISCAAVAFSKLNIVEFWHDPHGISKRKAGNLVKDMQNMENDGYKIVTWNGTKFDFRVLADVSGMYKDCAELAMNHLDMMLWVTCQKGYYLGLQAALKGAGLEGKLKEVILNDGTVLTDMSGAKAPELWRAGEFDAVLAYLEDDVRQPLALAHHIEENKVLRWRSRAGKPMSVYVPNLLTVKECLEMRWPDQGWMTDPPTKESFTEWMK